jgi:hypothetical protein
MSTFNDEVPEEHKQAVKEEMYDMFNIGASNVLQEFAPDIEARPDLTTEAIMKAEDEIMEEKIHQMSVDEIAEANKAIEMQREAIKSRMSLVKGGAQNETHSDADEIIPVGPGLS